MMVLNIFNHCTNSNKVVNVDIITNSNSAVNQILNNNYDIILLDLKMPRISGYDIIKELPKSYLEKIIVITALLQNNINNLVNQYNLEVLMKPLNMDIIKKTIIKKLNQNNQNSKSNRNESCIINNELIKKNQKVEMNKKNINLSNNLDLVYFTEL